MTGVQTCALPICFPVTICLGSTVDDVVDALGVPFEWVLEVRKWMDFDSDGFETGNFVEVGDWKTL